MEKKCGMISAFILIVLCLTVSGITAYADSEDQEFTTLKLIVFGEEYEYEYGTPYVKNGRTLVPIRDLLVSLGVPEEAIHYDSGSQTVSAAKDGIALRMKLGDSKLYKNGQLYADLDVSPEAKDSRIYLPARAVAEAFGNQVHYDAYFHAVVINQTRETSQERLNKQLTESGKNGDYAKVLSLLYEGADPETEVDGYSLLFEVMFEDGAEYGDRFARTAEALIVHGADVNASNDGWYSPLYYAVENNRYRLVELLLKYGADPNAILNPRYSYGQPIILQLSSTEFNGDDGERARMLELLHTYGANLESSDEYGHTLLGELIWMYGMDRWGGEQMEKLGQYPETLKKAIQLGARTGVHYIHGLDEEDRLTVLHLLLEAGLDMNMAYAVEPGAESQTMLERAVDLYKEPLYLMQLIALGADPSKDRSLEIVQRKMAQNLDSEVDEGYYEYVLTILEDFPAELEAPQPETGTAPEAEPFQQLERNLFLIEQDGLYGYIDSNGDTVIEPQFIHAEDFFDGMAIIKDEEGKVGYIDETGRVVVSPRYKYGMSFSEGLAPVWNDDYTVDFIDRSGSISIQTDYTMTFGFTDGVATVADTISSFRLDVIDREGQTVFETDFLPYDQFIPVIFREGYAVVWEEQKYYIDKTGERAFDSTFAYANLFSEEVASVAVMDRFGVERYGFIDQEGNFTIEPTFFNASYFSEGLAPVRDIMGKWGFIDQQGRIVIPMIYDDVYEFTEGLAAVRVGDDWGFINRQGEWVIEPRFDSVELFVGGLARFEENHPDGKRFGYVNRNGDIVWFEETLP